jgi:hypothetical protein
MSSVVITCDNQFIGLALIKCESNIKTEYLHYEMFCDMYRWIRRWDIFITGPRFESQLHNCFSMKLSTSIAY